MVTSSRKARKRKQCDYCEMNTFNVDHFLDIIRVWDSVMHLDVFLDVQFEDANK